MIISYDDKIPFNLFMDIRIGLWYYLLLGEKKRRKVSNGYTLNGQQKDLLFLCDEVASVELADFDAILCLPAFSSARETFGFI